MKKSCNDGPDLAFCGADPAQIIMLVASSQFSGDKSPFLSLGNVADHPAPAVRLNELSNSSSVIPDKSRAKCGNTEIRAFAVDVDKSDWSSYWSTAKVHKIFSVGVGIPGLDPSTRVDALGFAFLESASHVPSIRRGCMAK